MSCPMHPTGAYGCRWCDADVRRGKANVRLYTAADLLRVAEAVREACAAATSGAKNFVDVTAVDVAEVVRRVTSTPPR